MSMFGTMIDSKNKRGLLGRQ